MSAHDFLAGKMAYLTPHAGRERRVLVYIVNVDTDHYGEYVCKAMDGPGQQWWWRYPGQLELVPEDEQEAALALFELAGGW